MMKAIYAAVLTTVLLGLVLSAACAAGYPAVTSSFDSATGTFTYRVTMDATTTKYLGWLKVTCASSAADLGLDLAHPENYMSGAWVIDSTTNTRTQSLDWQPTVWDDGVLTLQWLPKQGQLPVAAGKDWIGEFEFKLSGASAVTMQSAAQPGGGPGTYPLYEAVVPTAVPEPSSLAALGAFAGLFFAARRRR